MTNQELSSHLMTLQRLANPPMGVSCVRSICHYLDVGDREGAKVVARNECDKISQYPDIIIIIHDNLVDLGCYYRFAKERKLRET